MCNAATDDDETPDARPQVRFSSLVVFIYITVLISFFLKSTNVYMYYVDYVYMEWTRNGDFSLFSAFDNVIHSKSLLFFCFFLVLSVIIISNENKIYILLMNHI